MLVVKALALSTLFQAALAATDTDYYVTYSDWKEGKLVDVQFQWNNIENKGQCQTLCSQYAENNTYVNQFLCTYEDGKSPHSCTISPDNNVKDKTNGVNNFKKCKGTPHGYTPSPTPVNLLTPAIETKILDVANNEASAINSAVVTELEENLPTITGPYVEDYISYTNWEVGKLVDVQFQWSGNITDGGQCQTQCTQYALDNNYANHFLCSYEDGKNPHTCAISPDNNVNHKTNGVNNWKKCKGTPETDGETLPLYSDSGKEIVQEGITETKLEYSFELIECYPKHGWNESLVIGPYTNITSDSFISPETFAGSVGIVGDVSLSKLVCTGKVSGDVYQQVPLFGWELAASGKGNMQVTVSAKGDATVTMNSTECTARNKAEGISLSPESCDLDLSETVNSCDANLIIDVLGISFNVGELACSLIEQDAVNIAKSLADASANAASNAVKDEFKNTYTYCIPITPAPDEVSIYSLLPLLSLTLCGIYLCHSFVFLIPSPRRRRKRRPRTPRQRQKVERIRKVARLAMVMIYLINNGTYVKVIMS